jgi:pSer/pThr/pTyr-binding forkhead associated (FHA) protein
MQTILLTSLLSVLTSAITAYIAAKLGMRAERRKWQSELALSISKARVENPPTAARMAQDFAGALLVIVRPGKDKEKVFVPPDGSLVVGRDSNCDIVLDDPNISRRHARFAMADNSVSVSDLHSREGTKVNGKRIDGVVILVDGDIVAMGAAEFVFHALRGGAQ